MKHVYGVESGEPFHCSIILIHAFSNRFFGPYVPVPVAPRIWLTKISNQSEPESAKFFQDNV
jgi:hypothetical protein